MKKKNEFIWSQKYRPEKIDDVILNKTLKRRFKKFIREENLSNLIFNGKSGIGKTTVAEVLCKELDFEYIIINGSKDGTIDVLRSKVERFASHMSMNGKRKVVIFDEGDNISDKSLTALQPFVEQFSRNCSFIFTTNHYEKFKAPIKSRFSVINFDIPEKDRRDVMNKTYARMCEILAVEGVEFNKKVVISVIANHFPDIRKIIDVFQQSVDNGVLSIDAIEKKSDIDDSLTHIFKENNVHKYDKIFKYVDKNNMTMLDVIGYFERNMEMLVDNSSIPVCIMILSDYDYKNHFVTNEAINVKSCLCKIVKDVRFK